MLIDAAVLLAGVTAGVASGMFGIGGGVILVPILGLLLGFSQHRAQGTSLVALIPPTGLLAVIAYAHTASMSGTFVSGVKFSRAKPNSTLIGEPPARWDGAGSPGYPLHRMHAPLAASLAGPASNPGYSSASSAISLVWPEPGIFSPPSPATSWKT